VVEGLLKISCLTWRHTQKKSSHLYLLFSEFEWWFFLCSSHFSRNAFPSDSSLRARLNAALSITRHARQRVRPDRCTVLHASPRVYRFPHDANRTARLRTSTSVSYVPRAAIACTAAYRRLALVTGRRHLLHPGSAALATKLSANVSSSAAVAAPSRSRRHHTAHDPGLEVSFLPLFPTIFTMDLGFNFQDMYTCGLHVSPRVHLHISYGGGGGEGETIVSNSDQSGLPSLMLSVRCTSDQHFPACRSFAVRHQRQRLKRVPKQLPQHTTKP
jgi:hypothetical protein